MFLHVGLETGPHIPVIEAILQQSPDDNVFVPITEKPSSKISRFLYQIGLVRRAIRTYHPDLVISHGWDESLQKLLAAKRWEGARLCLQRYDDTLLPAGTFRRAAYRKLEGFVVDSRRGKQIVDALGVERTTTIYQAPVTTPSGTSRRPDFPLGSKFVALTSTTMDRTERADVQATALTLLTDPHKVVLHDGSIQLSDTPRIRQLSYGDILRTADVMVMVGDPAQTYPRPWIQAREQGLPTVVKQVAVYDEFRDEGTETYARFIPSLVANQVNEALSRPKPPKRQNPSQPIPRLLETYERYAWSRP